MPRNVGTVDRVVRILIAIALFYVAMNSSMSSVLRIILAIVGGILIVTAVTGFCALYKLFGISTKKSSSDNQEPKQGQQ